MGRGQRVRIQRRGVRFLRLGWVRDDDAQDAKTTRRLTAAGAERIPLAAPRSTVAATSFRGDVAPGLRAQAKPSRPMTVLVAMAAPDTSEQIPPFAWADAVENGMAIRQHVGAGRAVEDRRVWFRRSRGELRGGTRLHSSTSSPS